MLELCQSTVIEQSDQSEKAAVALDEQDVLKSLRKQFCIPKQLVFADDTIDLRSEYLCFNASSLGLQPLSLSRRLASLNTSRFQDVRPSMVGTAGEMEFCSLTADKCCTALAPLLDCNAEELHLLGSVRVPMALALLAQQFQCAGTDVLCVDLLLLPHTVTSKPTDFATAISHLKECGSQIGVVLAPLLHSSTGELLDVQALVEVAREYGCIVGLEVSDAVGNILPIGLHALGVDFAVFSTERYLNGGSDSLTGIFLSARHRDACSISHVFADLEVHNSALYRLVALQESLDIFAAQSLHDIADKSAALVAYLTFLLPANGLELTSRGSSSLMAIRASDALRLRGALLEKRVVLDLRGKVLCVSLAPLYTSFLDVHRFVQHLQDIRKE